MRLRIFASGSIDTGLIVLMFKSDRWYVGNRIGAIKKMVFSVQFLRRILQYHVIRRKPKLRGNPWLTEISHRSSVAYSRELIISILASMSMTMRTRNSGIFMFCLSHAYLSLW